MLDSKTNFETALAQDELLNKQDVDFPWFAAHDE